MLFTTDTPNFMLVMVLLAVALVLTVACATALWMRACRLRRFSRYETEREYLPESELPAVSVVVYAHNDNEYLERFLPLLLHQDYPEYEVVVVDDGSRDGSRDTLSAFLPHFAHLRVTFSPEGTRALSRKKLSQMMGFKAAKYDIVLTTNANCRVMSDQWLRLMARNFVDGTDVVLGYSHYRYRKDRSAGRYYRIFDSVVSGAQWVLSAIAGKPYRGISDNLAYRKQVFFDHQGFSQNLDMRFGEDDVFVSEIAHSANTRMELHPDTVVQTYYEKVATAHGVLKLRRDFTSRFVAVKRQFYQQALFSAANYLRVVALVAAAVIGWQNGFALCGVLGLLILSWVLVIVPFNRICTALIAPRLSLSVPLFFLWRPVVNLIYRLRGFATRKSNYTSFYE